MENDSDIVTQLQRIRYDLTALQAKVTDALEAAAALNLKPSTRPVCPECGVSTKGTRSLAEHVYHSHDGPEPEHWAEAEARSDEPN